MFISKFRLVPSASSLLPLLCLLPSTFSLLPPFYFFSASSVPPLLCLLPSTSSLPPPFHLFSASSLLPLLCFLPSTFSMPPSFYLFSASPFYFFSASSLLPLLCLFPSTFSLLPPFYLFSASSLLPFLCFLPSTFSMPPPFHLFSASSLPPFLCLLPSTFSLLPPFHLFSASLPSTFSLPPPFHLFSASSLSPFLCLLPSTFSLPPPFHLFSASSLLPFLCLFPPIFSPVQTFYGAYCRQKDTFCSPFELVPRVQSTSMSSWILVTRVLAFMWGGGGGSLRGPIQRPSYSLTFALLFPLPCILLLLLYLFVSPLPPCLPVGTFWQWSFSSGTKWPKCCLVARASFSQLGFCAGQLEGCRTTQSAAHPFGGGGGHHPCPPMPHSWHSVCSSVLWISLQELEEGLGLRGPSPAFCGSWALLCHGLAFELSNHKILLAIRVFQHLSFSFITSIVLLPIMYV